MIKKTEFDSVAKKKTLPRIFIHNAEAAERFGTGGGGDFDCPKNTGQVLHIWRAFSFSDR